jgi:hypothetical protein
MPALPPVTIYILPLSEGKLSGWNFGDGMIDVL